MGVVNKLVAMLKDDGAAYVAHKLKKKVQGKLGVKKPLYSNRELEAQRMVEFPRDIKFSILVPLYNTPDKLLREMIESVLAQTYGNWELCLADGSDKEHGGVGDICAQYSAVDARVKYKKLSENKGISGNTNACIDMATGEYIALFDHDDLLHPAALYEMMCVICEQDADFIYTDEDSFHETPADAYSPHYKPDFSPDTLRSYNYICHFTAFSRELLECVGGFRSAYDGSQDYDIFLRLTECAKNIVHIPKILYYWRNHAGSVASDVSVKPYTMVSAKKALAEHLERVGLKGEVVDSSVLTTYKINYEINGQPLVSVVVSETENRQRCIDSIISKTAYPNYEIKAADEANGEYLVFVDGDVEVITPDWIEQMLMYAQRADVGAVGSMLWNVNDTVYSAGKILGVKNSAGDAHRKYPQGHDGYKFRMTVAQNYSAVSKACMMVRRELWQSIGFDEAFGKLMDVDFCLRLREKGYLVVWTPYAEMYYNGKGGLAVSKAEQKAFELRWGDALKHGDPYYNPNFTLLSGDFTEI